MLADEPPVPLPITGELDLHTFRPCDIGALIPVYLQECQSRGVFSVRIVHGKGTGTLRETVHALLRRSPLVRSFRLGDEANGRLGRNHRGAATALGRPGFDCYNCTGGGKNIRHLVS